MRHRPRRRHRARHPATPRVSTGCAAAASRVEHRRSGARSTRATILHWEFNHFVVFERLERDARRDRRSRRSAAPRAARRVRPRVHRRRALARAGRGVRAGEARKSSRCGARCERARARPRTFAAHPGHLALGAAVRRRRAGADGAARRPGGAARRLSPAGSLWRRASAPWSLFEFVSTLVRGHLLLAPAHAARRAHDARLSRSPGQPALRLSSSCARRAIS